MTPEVLPAMLSLRKFRHHERDVLGLFFPYDRALINQVKALPDRKYSATWRGWSLPCTALHRQSVQKLGQLASFSLDHLASCSGTSAAHPAPGDLKTTMIYTPITNPSWSTIQSPLDQCKLFHRFSKKTQE